MVPPSIEEFKGILQLSCLVLLLIPNFYSSSFDPEGEDDTPKSFWEQELEPGTGNRLELALSWGGRSKGWMLQMLASAGPGVTLDWTGVETNLGCILYQRSDWHDCTKEVLQEAPHSTQKVKMNSQQAN